MLRPILFFAAAAFLTAASTFASNAPSSISFNAVAPHGDATTVSLRSEDNQTSFEIVKQPLISTKDFASARIGAATKKGVSLLITLSTEGAHKLSAFTATHIGERLAILVDEHLIKTPMIRTEVKGPGLALDILDPAEANQLVALINQPRS